MKIAINVKFKILKTYTILVTVISNNSQAKTPKKARIGNAIKNNIYPIDLKAFTLSSSGKLIFIL